MSGYSSYMKYYYKNQQQESTYYKYWHVNKLCWRAMSQKVPVNGFNWVENTSQFNEDFLKKSYNQECDERYFIDINVQNPAKLRYIHNDLPLNSLKNL